MKPIRIIPVLGDQLNLSAPALSSADPASDVIVMAEVEAEIRRHPNHKQRVVYFLSAMRHFRNRLEEAGFTIIYQQIGDTDAAPSLVAFLEQQIEALNPEQLVMTEAGRYDLEQSFLHLANSKNVPLEVLPDTHYFCTREAFASWAAGRKSLVMEYFYRQMRKDYGYLMEGNKPTGGAWNFDKKNRGSFGKKGPGLKPEPKRFPPDAITQQVIEDVERLFPDLPGTADTFDWPVTPTDAEEALSDFVKHRLELFGTYQDAMWTEEPYLYHSRLSPALNVKLLDPREVVELAIGAYEAGKAPLNAVEGFVRQILGWREFIRGVYWLNMPGYETSNALGAAEDLPSLFWTGDTDMVCLRQVVTQLLKHGYAHHIQRLMVAGLFTLMYGVEPRQVHDWFMALYTDSVEWVTMPNTIGMSQFADGGIVGTKPYVATGKYIKRMSNYCGSCRYNPDQAIGEEACPFTTLYWAFLIQHEERMSKNQRMAFQVRNLKRKSPEDRQAILDQAEAVRDRLKA